MTLFETLSKAKIYLHKDSNLPGVPDDYKLAKDLQHRLSKAITRLESFDALIDDTALYLLIEGWLMINPTRSALQWDISKEAFKKHMLGE